MSVRRRVGDRVRSAKAVMAAIVLVAIAAPGELGLEAKETYDAAGKVVIPGVIDGHVHFREPGFEYKEDWRTGSTAAVFGGVTTVIDMPNTNSTGA